MVLLSSHGPVVAGPLPGVVRVWRCHLCISTIELASVMLILMSFPQSISLYMLAIAGDNCECIAKPSSFWYVYSYSEVCCLCTKRQHLHQVLVYWYILLDMSLRPVCPFVNFMDHLICEVACYNIVTTVCMGSGPCSWLDLQQFYFCFYCWVFLYYSNQFQWGLPAYSVLSAGSMMMMLFLCRALIASLSSFVMFDLGGLAFSSICLTFHLSSSVWAWGMFKVISSIGTMMSKYGIHLMGVAKLRRLFSMESSEGWGWSTLCITFWSLNLFNFCIWQALTPCVCRVYPDHHAGFCFTLLYQ